MSMLCFISKLNKKVDKLEISFALDAIYESLIGRKLVFFIGKSLSPGSPRDILEFRALSL